MKKEQQQRREIQGELLTPMDYLRPYAASDLGKETGAGEERQTFAASTEMRALTTNLMEKVCERHNLNLAYRRVKANKGAPGVDGMTVGELSAWLKTHKDALKASLMDGSYQPNPVRGIEIPKSGGRKRQLGIPTVRDRLVQQALLQVLESILDPTFSPSSFGFRPKRSAHDALRQASCYVEEGRTYVVDCDLEKFFDRINHDILMARVAKRIGDKRLLRIIRGFLEAGMMQNGVVLERHGGTPQGGPLSPLLANLLLDDLDKELERRGHRFCRYADDCNVYVASEKAGKRVMASITNFIEGKLKLKVNKEKSAVAPVWERQFLGYRLKKNGGLAIAPKSLKKMKGRIREITKRNRSKCFERRVQELNEFLAGWITYFRLSDSRSRLSKLDQWIRRKLRCVRLKERKRSFSIVKLLTSQDIKEKEAWKVALSGKGWWRLSNTPQVNMAMDNYWFYQQRLVSLTIKWDHLKLRGNRLGT